MAIERNGTNSTSSYKYEDSFVFFDQSDPELDIISVKDAQYFVHGAVDEMNLAHKEAGIVYGNYHPVTTRFFEKCAAISYVAPLQKNKIRGKFIASSLFKKEGMHNIRNIVGGWSKIKEEKRIKTTSSEKNQETKN